MKHFFNVKFPDGHWYRALNTETVTETQSSKLMFLDYGNNEDVPFQDIRPMVPDFVSAPVVMVMCYLDGKCNCGVFLFLEE